MDFDEYEYLEKAVENPEPEKAKKENGNGSVDPIKSEERNRSRSSKHRREDKADDLDDRHLSKHLKSREETSRDHDRHKERGSSHRRSRSREGEKDRHRSRRDQRGKDRDKDRDMDRDMDRDREERNGREREKERVRKDRDRESERDREREKEREQPEREADKSHDKEFKERENERESRGPDRQNRRYKEKKEDGAEPEVDPERDQRTVFAYQISLKATERDVYEFFVRAGKVRDVRLIMDRNSRRSKGVGYVEFYDVMSVPMAIALSGQPLLGQPVMVKPSEAEKNLVQSTTTVPTGQTGPYAAGGRRLYVGNLHFNITEEQLRQVFEAFGTVELVQLPFDETGHSKGFGFVQFGRLEDAKNALNLNGQLEIGGRVIKVSTVTDQGVLQDVGTNAAELDDDDGGGFSLNSSSRALLMAKLDRSGTASSITASMGMPVNNSTGLTASTAPIIGVSPLLSSLVPPSISGLPGGLQLPTNGIPTIDTIGTPSECLLLKNMFDPTLETEPDFDIDIKEDVKEECTKFGNLKHIHVESDSAGFVYLRFEDTQGAINAQRNLHGRWFAGKMITATFMVPEIYEAKFPNGSR